MRPPGFSDPANLALGRHLLQPVRGLHRMTHPEVPGWQHIGPPELPEQEHVGRPRADRADRDQLIVRLVIDTRILTEDLLFTN
jgi:hypothetical protein